MPYEEKCAGEYHGLTISYKILQKRVDKRAQRNYALQGKALSAVSSSLSTPFREFFCPGSEKLQKGIPLPTYSYINESISQIGAIFNGLWENLPHPIVTFVRRKSAMSTPPANTTNVNSASAVRLSHCQLVTSLPLSVFCRFST